MTTPVLIPAPVYPQFGDDAMIARAESFRVFMNKRRTIREFAPDPVPMAAIKACIGAAATAPSGANLQPWHFAVVTNTDVKRRIRVAAEKEEREFYEHRAPQAWLDALAPIGTDAEKPFLEIAPCLIAIFVERYGETPEGKRVKHYYANESVGIATGILLTALHRIGLATLTHTPSPMGFLNEILERPSNEKPFLLLVVGYAAQNATVPDLRRKEFAEVASFH